MRPRASLSWGPELASPLLCPHDVASDATDRLRRGLSVVPRRPTRSTLEATLGPPRLAVSNPELVVFVVLLVVVCAGHALSFGGRHAPSRSAPEFSSSRFFRLLPSCQGTASVGVSDARGTAGGSIGPRRAQTRST